MRLCSVLEGRSGRDRPQVVGSRRHQPGVRPLRSGREEAEVPPGRRPPRRGVRRRLPDPHLRSGPAPSRQRRRQGRVRSRARLGACTTSASPSSRATASIPRCYEEAEARVLDLVRDVRARGEAALPGAAARVGQPGLLSRSRRRATSIPTWSRAGCSAAAPSTWTASASFRADDVLAAARAGAVLPPALPAQEALFLPVMQSLLALPRLRSASLRPPARRAPTSACGSTTTRPSPAADEAAGAAAACSATRTWTCSPSCRRPRVEGLQVFNRANMKWIRLTAPPGHDHPQHGRLHAAHQQRPAALHHASREPAARSRRCAARASLPDGRLRVGRRGARGPAGPRPAEVPAGQGHRFHTRITSKYYGDDYAVGE